MNITVKEFVEILESFELKELSDLPWGESLYSGYPALMEDSEFKISGATLSHLVMLAISSPVMVDRSEENPDDDSEFDSIRISDDPWGEKHLIETAEENEDDNDNEPTR